MRHVVTFAVAGVVAAVVVVVVVGVAVVVVVVAGVPRHPLLHLGMGRQDVSGGERFHCLQERVFVVQALICTCASRSPALRTQVVFGQAVIAHTAQNCRKHESESG